MLFPLQYRGIYCRSLLLVILCCCFHISAYENEAALLEKKIAVSDDEAKIALIIDYIRDGNRFTPEKSITYASDALNIIGPNHASRATLLNYLALSYYHLNEFTKSRSLLEEALIIAQQQKNIHDEMLVLMSFSLLANELRNHDEALVYIGKGLNFAQSLNELQFMGDFNALKATVYSESYNSDKAIEAALLAYQYYQQTNDVESMVQTLNNSASIYRSFGALDKALEYQLKALSLILTTSNVKQIAINYNNIAILYKDIQDYDNAITMHLESLKIKMSIGYLRGQVYSHNNLGEAYRLAGKTSEALEHLTQAAHLADRINSQKLLHYSYLYLGRLHRDVAEYKIAAMYLNKAIIFFEKTKRTSRLSEAYLALAKLLLAEEELELSIDAARNSLLYGKQSSKNVVVLQSYQMLSTLYEKLNDYQSALANEKEFQRLKDTIFNEQQQRFMQTLRVEYDVEQKQRKITDLIQQNKISTLEVEQEKTRGYVYVMSSLFIFSLIAFFYYRLNQRKKLADKRIALEKIQAKEQDLRELNANLESIVEQRTQSLTTTNKALETTLLDLKNTQDNLIEVEKMASLSKLVAGVAHEVNTPLGTIVTASSFLNESLAAFKSTVENNEVTRDGLNTFLMAVTQSSQLIANNTARSAELISEFKQISIEKRSDPPQAFILADCIEKVMTSLLAKVMFKRVNYTLTLHGSSAITSYSAYWLQILESLLSNTVEHGFSNDEQRINVTLTIEECDKHIKVTYTDDGCGIPQDKVHDIFEPFYTTLRHKGHVGLGLHIIYNMVAQTLSGSMHYQEKKKGACFVIVLPQTLSLVAESNEQH
ncbi:hypothetical protein GCM10009111_09130 [Colwellia asteriadis]|uniref:histidine kinase n=1 Tax=Colwellia asteriadis TaxID=517723 RepID=A0ABN1L4H1_9GAMM